MQIELQGEGEAFPQITEQRQIMACGLCGFDQTKKKEKSEGRETNKPLFLSPFLSDLFASSILLPAWCLYLSDASSADLCLITNTNSLQKCNNK